MVSPSQIRQAKRIIFSGGIIAHPTEAVFGLACDPNNLQAVLQLVTLKKRSLEKGLILVASSVEQLEPYVELSKSIRNKIGDSWPGPHTWLIPTKSGISNFLCGIHDTLAVRVSAHPVVQALCKECDQPLVSSSANLQFSPPARSALAVRRIFGQNIDLILHGKVDFNASPTEIRDAQSGKIIRAS